MQGRTTSSEGTEFCIVLATGRPIVATFFSAIGGRGNGVRTTTFDLGETAQPRVMRAVQDASVALVDASIDPNEAVDVCRQLQAQRADLPLGVLFCCPRAAAAASLRTCREAGIGSFLDLQQSSEQTLSALRSIARGETVVRLALSEDSSSVLFNSHREHERLAPRDLELLRLVARGLTDHEIGDELCLSHHTIKHRIERLRSRLHARNRTHLAAVCGRFDDGLPTDW
jgi:DNA-binding NarL/FixJ family response regulator